MASYFRIFRSQPSDRLFIKMDSSSLMPEAERRIEIRHDKWRASRHLAFQFPRVTVFVSIWVWGRIMLPGTSVEKFSRRNTTNMGTSQTNKWSLIYVALTRKWITEPPLCNCIQKPQFRFLSWEWQNINLLPCLIKHHAMKPYGWRGGGIRWRWLVSIRFRLLYHRGVGPPIGSRAIMEARVKRKFCFIFEPCLDKNINNTNQHLHIFIKNTLN